MSELAITQVGRVIVPVADQDRALEFWGGDRNGFRVVETP